MRDHLLYEKRSLNAMKNIYLKILFLSMLFLMPLSASELPCESLCEEIDDCIGNRLSLTSSLPPQEPESCQDLILYQSHLPTLIHHIQNHRTDEAIRLIHQNFTPLDVPDEDGKFPLHWACLMGNQRLFIVLITKNPSQRSTPDQEGATPLHCASMAGSISIIQSLLDLGAHLDEEMNDGRTALDLACPHDQGATKEFLQNKKSPIPFGETHREIVVSRASYPDYHTSTSLIPQETAIVNERMNAQRIALHFGCVLSVKVFSQNFMFSGNFGWFHTLRVFISQTHAQR